LQIQDGGIIAHRIAGAKGKEAAESSKLKGREKGVFIRRWMLSVGRSMFITNPFAVCSAALVSKANGREIMVF
jgi:hypothetical protein